MFVLSRNEDQFDFDDSHGHVDSTRIWLSDEQWLALLRGLEEDVVNRSHRPAGLSDATGERQHSRLAPDLQCVLRIGGPGSHRIENGSDHGTWMLSLRNVSRGGLGFTHSHAVETETFCTLGIKPQNGAGVVMPARVAWCKPVERDGEDPSHFEIGVAFDKPLELMGLSNQVTPSTPLGTA